MADDAEARKRAWRGQRALARHLRRDHAWGVRHIAQELLVPESEVRLMLDEDEEKQ